MTREAHRAATIARVAAAAQERSAAAMLVAHVAERAADRMGRAAGRADGEATAAGTSG